MCQCRLQPSWFCVHEFAGGNLDERDVCSGAQCGYVHVGALTAYPGVVLSVSPIGELNVSAAVTPEASTEIATTSINDTTSRLFFPPGVAPAGTLTLCDCFALEYVT
mgnify:CR=1 FL=1